MTQWQRFCLYIAAGLTALALLFPPYAIDHGADEYGFVFAGPPSVSQAVERMAAIGGQHGRDMAAELIPYRVDLVRLTLELAATWGVYLALRQTVLKQPMA